MVWPKIDPKKQKRLESTKLHKKTAVDGLERQEKNWIKLRFVFSFRGEKMVAMMEEYAEIDLIKTRRLQIEVMRENDRG